MLVFYGEQRGESFIRVGDDDLHFRRVHRLARQPHASHSQTPHRAARNSNITLSVADGCMTHLQLCISQFTRSSFLVFFFLLLLVLCGCGWCLSVYHLTAAGFGLLGFKVKHEPERRHKAIKTYYHLYCTVVTVPSRRTTVQTLSRRIGF